jgi:hypothetical protein
VLQRLRQLHLRLAAHQVVAHVRALRENVRLQRRLERLMLVQGLLPALGLDQPPPAAHASCNSPSTDKASHCNGASAYSPAYCHGATTASEPESSRAVNW